MSIVVSFVVTLAANVAAWFVCRLIEYLINRHTQ